MLQALTFTDKYLGERKDKFILDTTNNGLTVSFEFDGKTIRHPCAAYIEDGIYWGNNFHIILDMYTDFEEVENWREAHELFKAIESSKDEDEDEDERNKLREQLNFAYRMLYGNADSLDQIKEKFRSYLDDPERLYVLAMYEDGAFVTHKNGPYIGTKDLTASDTVLYFHFHEIKRKQNT